MSLGLRETRQYAKRQKRGRFYRRGFLIVVLVGLGVLAYVVGAELAQQEVIGLRDANRELGEQATELEREVERLETEAEAARQRELEWRARYQREVPRGATLALARRIESHLDAGADPERIELYLDASVREARCDNQPRSKRFLVRTPLYSGANDSVSFADSALTATASGTAATDAAGNPEAWFDPAMDISFAVIAISGERSETAGPLPLHHSVIWAGAEYRFTVVNGASRGFVTVTADRCALAATE